MDILPKENLYIIGVIIFGAVVHATSQLKTHRDKKQEFTIVDFLILMVIASFAGFVFYYLAVMFNLSEAQTIFSASMGSSMGMVGLNRLGMIFLDFISSRMKKDV